jgi:hypothetical protein
MLSKRVLVLAADKPLQKRLAAAAMSAGAAVQTLAALDDAPPNLDAELALVTLPLSTAVATAAGKQPAAPVKLVTDRLPEHARIVLFIPTPDLEWTVALLAEPRVAAVLVIDGLSNATVTATVSKLLQRDLFGVEKMMPCGVRVYSTLIGDYQEKSQAILTIGEFAQAMGVRKKYREQIEQCMDEMLMNALYDAPVDDDGKPLFADVPVKERVLMRVDQKAIVQYACDGERFAVSVRDAFGTLEKSTVAKYLDKCLHAPEGQQIDRKTGGAGLGLYLIANAATEAHFHIFSGSATEVACAFDLNAPRAQMRAFGIFEEHVEGAPKSVDGVIRTVQTRRGNARRREDVPAPPPKSSPLLPVMMTFAVVLLLFSVTLVALPYLRKPALAAMHVDSEPAGATIYVDGRARGAAPLDIADLEAGKSYALRATRPGFRDDEQLVTAAAGKSAATLHLVELKAEVSIESEPGGARVVVDGNQSGKLTPATLDVPPEKHIVVRLEKDGFAAQELALTAPGPGERATFHAILPLSPTTAMLTIAAEPAAATVSLDGLVLSPPAPAHDTFVAPGSKHRVKASAPGFVDERQEVSLAGGEHKTVRLVLSEGGMLALKLNVPAHVSVDDKGVGQAPLAPFGILPGEHTLTLHGADKLAFSTPFTIDKGQTLKVELELKPDRTVAGRVGEKTVAGKW